MYMEMCGVCVSRCLVDFSPGCSGPRNWLLNGVAGPDGKCRNDSMSFVDVRDCAAQHVAAMELEKEGRFMSFFAGEAPEIRDVLVFNGMKRGWIWLDFLENRWD